MYIKRNLEDTILQYLNAPEIIAIVGARQSGKTTMVQHIIERLDLAVSVSFDDQDILGMFENRTKDFIATYIKGNKYLFIDEFQYAKNGGKILKKIYDTEKIKIIISGSSVADLTIHAIRYLVGRILIFDIYPFNFEEFLLAKDENYLKLLKEYKKKLDIFNAIDLKTSEQPLIDPTLQAYYEEYLIFGGYPRVVLEKNFEFKKNLLKNIYNTYFLREVRDVLGLIDDYKLNKLIKGLALQVGNLMEYIELSNLSGYSYPSLKKYLNFLEKTYICRFIKPFYKNKRTEVVKNPKAYFLDTGLRNAVLNDFRMLTERVDKGVLLENGLAMQFIKSEIELHFWRDKKKNELDFILLLKDGNIIGIESKSYLKNIETYSTKAFNRFYPNIKIYFSFVTIDKNIKNAYPIYAF